MKIGFYLAYGPNTKLGKEGLGRYMGSLISGFIKEGNEVLLACPEWLLPSLNDLLIDFQVNVNTVRFIVSSKRPTLWRLYDAIRNRRKPQTLLKFKLYRKLCGLGDAILSIFTSISNLFIFCLLTFFCCVAGLLVLPFFLIFIALFFLRKGIKALIRNQRYGINKIREDFNYFYETFSKGGMSVERTLYNQMLKRAEQSTVRKINKSGEGIADIWFCPAAFWKGFSNIKGTIVLNVPDLVTGEFCGTWANHKNYIHTDADVKETILSCKYYITYCEYVKKTLMIDRFGISDTYTKVIPHANNDMLPYIRFNDEMAARMNVQGLEATTNYARNLLNVLWQKNITVRNYIKGFHFQDAHYIFYASQNRPHKNILTLIKAYHHLLRRRYCNVKMILTGDIANDTSIWDYVEEYKLQLDVIPFVAVSAQELAALYRCADLVVNPSLYEGGFPFTFGEGMSVGIPSVMSDIPQIRDVVEPFGLADEMLFDPYDWKAMADKIEYGLKHRDELYQKELPMYREMEKRTSDVVAKEYISAFEYFIELNKNEKNI